MAAPFSLGDYVYAHRGLWSHAGPPENSMAAYDAAIAANIGMEFDVRLSADGIPVCFHDNILDRLTDNSGALAEYTASALGDIRLEQTEHTIPTLEAVLARWPHHLPLLVEIKAMDIPPIPVAEATAAQLVTYAGRAAAMSFNVDAVAALPKSLPRGLLIEKVSKSSEDAFEASMQTALDLQVDYLSVWRDDVARAAPFARAHGLGHVTWTVQTVEQSAMVAPHVDAQIIEGFDPALTAGT
ncbi:MAG: glycerophosphodiester phosphodiesterase family protein [Hyphomonadaceae bacterium]